MLEKKFSKINNQIVQNDKLRLSLVRNGEIEAFIDTYTKKYDTKNLNTGILWNEIFKTTGSLKDQSSMTKDKISSIVKFISEKPISILDLGIGQGFAEENLLERRNVNYKLHGIDISPDAIHRAKTLFKGNYIIGNVLNINKYFKTETMDLIIALELLEHLSPSTIFSFYGQVGKILNKKGVFIVTIPINEGLSTMKNNPNAHVRDYSFPVIETELRLNGFKIIHKKYLYAFNGFYFYKNLLSKIFKNKWKPNSLIIVARKVSKSEAKKLVNSKSKARKIRS